MPIRSYLTFVLLGSLVLQRTAVAAQEPEPLREPPATASNELSSHAAVPSIPPSPSGSPAAAAGNPASPPPSEHGIRLAMQARLDVLHVGGVSTLPNTTVPIVAPGVRLIDDLLFVGLGLEFFTVSDDGPKGFAISPVVTYDLLSEKWAALYVAGWINLGTQNPEGPVGSHFLFGANAGVGMRAKVHQALAIGTEWGWAFNVVDDGAFSQGIFGTVMLEVSYGI